MTTDLANSKVLNRMSAGIDTPPQGRAGRAAISPSATLGECVVRMVSTNVEFDELAPAWKKLLEESDSTVFQSFEWCRTWWKYYAKANDTLSIFVFIVDNEIVGIAPLFRGVARIAGVRLYSRLQSIGCGLSDYADIIIRRGSEEMVLSSLVNVLRNSAGDWDVVDLVDVNESALLMRYLPAAMEGAGMQVYLYQGNVCPRIALSSPGNSLPTTSYNFRRKFKKLRQAFNVDIELVRKSTDDLRSAIDAFAAVHGNRWKSLGYRSAFDNERIKAFHEELAERFAERDWLRLYLLRVDGVPTATSFHFNYKQRIYMYQSNAHGTDAVMRCSPGYIIRALSMTDGINEGMQVFDYLRGDEPYKYNEGDAVESKNFLFRAKSPAAGSQLRFVVFLAHELLRKCADRIGREYYDYRRFKILEEPTMGRKVLYVRDKMLQLFVLAYNFAIRHSPVKSLRRLVIAQRNSSKRNGPAPGKKPEEGAGGAASATEYRFRKTGKFSINKLFYLLRRITSTPRILEERASPLSGNICVRDVGRERQLVINNETHSIIFTRGSWGEARREYWGQISRTPFGLPEQPRVLLLGAGGGTTAHLVARDLARGSLTVVERDPVIIDLAKRFFSFDKIPGLRILTGDAADVMKRLHTSGERFDLVIDDVYFTLYDVASGEGRAIVDLLSSLLAPGGTVALNRVVDDDSAGEPLQQLHRSLKERGFDVSATSVRQRWRNDLIFFRKADR